MRSQDRIAILDLCSTTSATSNYDVNENVEKLSPFEAGINGVQK